MLRALINNVLRPSKPAAAAAGSGREPNLPDRPLRLHIGGQQPHPDWKIVNITPGEHTDYVRSCTDLSIFEDASVEEIYASHVVEHLGYQRELGSALTEFNRVLVPGGTLRVSVPDLPTLCTLYLAPESDSNARFMLMRMMFGGQIDDGDFHCVGFDEQLMRAYLGAAGFGEIQRVRDLGLFNDASRMVFQGYAISLNMTARKPASESAAPDDQRAV